MSKTGKPSKPLVPTSNYVSHYDPAQAHHRAWLQAVLDRLVALDPAALAEGSELRDLWKAAARTKAPPVQAPKAQVPPLQTPQAWPEQPATNDGILAAMTVALPLIREFEGCKLTAYPDPETGAEPWTIGWGATTYADGSKVRQSDCITQQEADILLNARLARDAMELVSVLPPQSWQALSINQRAALLSFSYNCGPYWFGSPGYATLSELMRKREWKQVPAALMLYVNPGGPSEAGLRRRRKAEGALWSAAPLKTNEAAAPQERGFPNPLVGVPRFGQRDSAQIAQRDRSCFSSSCAMLLEAIKPGTLKGPNGDDQYLAVVQRFGDTTDANAQLRALAHYGVTARLVQNADFQLIEQQINRGIPVPCGYIHRGPVQRPTGSGHWLIIYGHTSSHVVVNDPWGEPDLIHGTTLKANGMALKFSRANFGYRWMVEPIGGAAYRYAPGKGWAVVVDKVA